MTEYFWNKDKTQFICLGKVRNFEVIVKSVGTTIIAWFNDMETLEVGKFDSKEAAAEFLETLVTFTPKGDK
jgi:hypothetical protein